MYLSVRKSLHTGNVDKISAEQLKHIAKPYDEELFNYYKKQLFLRWISENTVNSIAFVKKSRKLAKTLNIVLTDIDQEMFDRIEAREFTERRALKTIEVPYKGLPNTTLLRPDAFFFYKGIRTYKKRIMMFEKKYSGEIYMTKREVVLYDRKGNKVQLIIPHQQIEEITLKNEYVEMRLKRKEDSLYFRYKDNELIYISLRRTVPIGAKTEFLNEAREEFMTAERTLESLLHIPSNTTEEKNLKADKKKKIKKKSTK